MPDTFAAFEFVYFLELVRSATVEHVCPLAATTTGRTNIHRELEACLEATVEVSGTVSLTLSERDARRPLISENAELWAYFEGHLHRRLADRDRQTPMSTRVRNTLLELLPSGRATMDAACETLRVSKRSLQRHLKDEGQTYQAILDATRAELSMHYLSRGELSVEEISYLLAYRDPNSFYRAFHVWTGMTPDEARGRRAH